MGKGTNQGRQGGPTSGMEYSPAARRRQRRRGNRPTIAGEVVTRKVGDPAPTEQPPAPTTRNFRGKTYG